MQARATATSTASRSHSTSDHLLSVVSAAKKLALFARFEKPARSLVPADVPTWSRRVSPQIATICGSLLSSCMSFVRNAVASRPLVGATLLQIPDFYGETFHVD
jgi:hypothetical protein